MAYEDPEKRKAWSRKYYLKNREKLKAYAKEYTLKNKKKRRYQRKEFRLKNKERLKTRHKEYHLKNREKINANKKEYYLKYSDELRAYSLKRSLTPEGVYQSTKQRARRKSIFCATRKQFIEWYIHISKICEYCQMPEYYLSTHIIYNRKKRLEIDRKDNSQGYTIENIVLACPYCNLIKSNILTFEEMKEIGQKYVKPKWDKSKIIEVCYG